MGDGWCMCDTTKAVGYFGDRTVSAMPHDMPLYPPLIILQKRPTGIGSFRWPSLTR